MTGQQWENFDIIPMGVDSENMLYKAWIKTIRYTHWEASSLLALWIHLPVFPYSDIDELINSNKLH